MRTYSDEERLDYLMGLLDCITPNVEKQNGANLNRNDVDRVMTLWPTPRDCFEAMVPPNEVENP